MTYISRLGSWLRCVASFLPAAGVALLLCVLLDGPRLGTAYDVLLKLRRTPPASRELLIIDSAIPGQGLGDDILEPGAASSLLYTMTELGARMLIIQVPILGLSAGGSVGEEEILYHFDEEFSILSRNIRNLFEGIKTGSVAPSESARYVGELVELSEKGKERLVYALVRRDEEGIISMEKAAAFFGHARRPGDLRVQLIRAGQSGQPGVLAESGEYSRARPDRDGVLRRVAPVITVPLLSEGEAGEGTLDHIIYGALKTRYIKSEIKNDGPKQKKLLGGMHQVLILLGESGEKDKSIPLDRNGAVLVEKPHGGEEFRRIGISDFLAYEEADRSLRRLLLEGEALGIFRNIEGENNPGILYDYALSLREEPASYFRGGMEEKRSAWIEARQRYFTSLEKFLSGPEERNLTGTIESLKQNFTALKARQNEVLALREKLESALASSFCILGNSTDVEASALLANSILQGRSIKPGADILLFLGTLFSVLLVCIINKSRGPLSTLGVGALFTIFIGIGFSSGFILSGVWLNPLVPLAASVVSIFVSFTWALIARSLYSRRFRQAYGPFVSRSCLKAIIQAGKPLPSRAIKTRTAVVAIKNTEPVSVKTAIDTVAQNSAEPQITLVLGFHEKVVSLSRKNGGTVVGVEGDMVTVCFGSPLERVYLTWGKKAPPREDSQNAPALRAIDFVSELVLRPECKSWCFGIDIGNCTFTWTALSGYFAIGVSIQRARILARMAGRYKARILVSSSINDALPDLPSKKLDPKGENLQEPIYIL